MFTIHLQQMEGGYCREYDDDFRRTELSDMTLDLNFHRPLQYNSGMPSIVVIQCSLVYGNRQV
jgi:hypothetical protein